MLGSQLAFRLRAVLPWQDDIIPGDLSVNDGAAGGLSRPPPFSGPVAIQGTPVGSSLVTTVVPASPVPPVRSTAPVADSVPDEDAEAQNDEVRQVAYLLVCRESDSQTKEGGKRSGTIVFLLGGTAAFFLAVTRLAIYLFKLGCVS